MMREAILARVVILDIDGTLADANATPELSRTVRREGAGDRTPLRLTLSALYDTNCASQI